MIRDRSTSAQNEPPKRLTEPKHYCNETCSPLVPSRKKKRKKGGVSLTSKGTIASNKYKHYPRRREERRKNKKKRSSEHPYPSRHHLLPGSRHLLHPGHQASPAGLKRGGPPSSRCPVDPQQMSHSVTGSWQNPQFFLPSYTRCAQSISMLRPFREGIHLERLTLRKPATSEPSSPSGNPTSLTLFLLLLSSISVIFSVSRSSWFLKSVTALRSSRVVARTESTRSRVCFAVAAMASNSSLSSLTELLVACMSSRNLRNAGISTESTASLTVKVTTESKVLCCSLNANLIPLAIATSISSLEMVESLNLFFIGDCPISLFRSPLTVEVLMMSPMQSGSKFTDRIIKYLTKSAERKTTRAVEVEGSRDLPGTCTFLSIFLKLYFYLYLSRVIIRAIFPGRVLVRISILPKISRFWLCLRAVYDIRFLMFSKHSRGTLNQSKIEILARTRPGKMARMVTLLKYKFSKIIYFVTFKS